MNTTYDQATLVVDSGAVIAILSLIISILSTFICLGQVVQHYVCTAQPIRLCDSIVYGGRNGLPGQGRDLQAISPCLFGSLTKSRSTGLALETAPLPNYIRDPSNIACSFATCSWNVCSFHDQTFTVLRLAATNANAHERAPYV